MKTFRLNVSGMNARYDVDGSRLVAGIVPLSKDKSKVLIVESTRKKNCWVLPKGGWETDESEAETAAQREAWEEAGITGKVTKFLGKIRDNRSSANAVFLFFEMTVEEELSEWPEMKKRKRKWVSYKEAAEKFGSRSEMLDALDRSCIKR
ncbi:Diphosphoinositol polyphosphate phosphohydrolase aps1 [Drechslerella dactyloides]|uniref:Diphosphoinositol polyphosphate phosphohydrolase aps1 n=1 Tax=Drechslerella dactyloides TaxID=74499 RepID=A0AAD6IX05_DREDA|nr:Diphosphoinositol polyphosphate phosphohydrolase aps1 [Drechslerella dactyloides]